MSTQKKGRKIFLETPLPSYVYVFGKEFLIKVELTFKDCMPSENI